MILLAVTGVCLGQEAFTDTAMFWLQIASGGIVVLLGCYLLYRRWPSKVLPPHVHEHAHFRDHADPQVPHHAPEHHAPEHHAPERFRFCGDTVTGTLAIVDTPEGERFRLEISSTACILGATVRITSASQLNTSCEFTHGHLERIIGGPITRLE